MDKPYLLLVSDNDNQYSRHTADDDDNCQSQQRPFCVAYSLDSFLDTGHHFRGSNLQDSPAGGKVGLELLVNVQEFTVKEPGDDKHLNNRQWDMQPHSESDANININRQLQACIWFVYECVCNVECKK